MNAIWRMSVFWIDHVSRECLHLWKTYNPIQFTPCFVTLQYLHRPRTNAPPASCYITMPDVYISCLLFIITIIMWGSLYIYIYIYRFFISAETHTWDTVAYSTHWHISWRLRTELTACRHQNSDIVMQQVAVGGSVVEQRQQKRRCRHSNKTLLMNTTQKCLKSGSTYNDILAFVAIGAVCLL